MKNYSGLTGLKIKAYPELAFEETIGKLERKEILINSLKNRDFLRIKEEEIEEKKIVYSEKAENKYEIIDAQDPNPTVENPTISSIQSSFCIIS